MYGLVNLLSELTIQRVRKPSTMQAREIAAAKRMAIPQPELEALTG